MKKFSIQDAWGVASLRQCTGFPCGNGLYCAPLESCIVTWNIETKAKTIFQAHGDLISVMLKSINKHVLTVSFSGEVKIWDENFKLLVSFELPSNCVIYGSWSHDGSLFSICTKGPKQMIIIYNLQSVFDDYKQNVDVRYEWKSYAPQEAERTDVFDCYNAGLFTKNNQVIAVYQSEKNCQLYSFSSDGKLIKFVGVSPLGDDKNVMLCVSSIHDDIIAVGLEKGLFGLYNIVEMQLTVVLQASGSPQVCIWDGDMLVTMSYLSGTLSWWKKDGTLIKEFTGGPSSSNVQMNLSLQEKNAYWIGGIMSLHYIILSEEKVINKYNLSFLELTGCGVAVNNDIVSSGDFTGQLLVWKYSQATPIMRYHLSSQIRCLLSINNYILVGCLDGNIYVQTADSQESIYKFDGGVITMHLNNPQTKLAVGTTGGSLYVFSVNKSANKLNMSLLYRSLQHEPKKIKSSEERPMEIWSLVWSTDDEMIATCSEDYTTAIADSNNGKVLRVLRGHTTAVTSADWKIVCDKNVLATCADDRTIRVYDGVSFDLLRVLNTYDIYGWHTLTYLVINNKMNFLACSTQNGYVVIWDLVTYDCLVKKKLHGGSIEGLVLDEQQEFLITTSSDCVVQRFSVEGLM